MVRVTTNNYGAATDTQFAWATSGNDLFSRTQDLYRLAQAVEFHDHSATRGLPVARLANNAVTDTSILALSVTTTKLADLAVTTAKIADGAVTDAKLSTQKVLSRNPLIANFIASLPSGSGFFDISPTADGPNGTDNWLLYQNRHWNWEAGTYGAQIAMSLFDANKTYIRHVANNVGGPWNLFWHSGNDGATSTLDAGLLGGQAPAFYATASALTSGLAALVTFPLNGVVWFQNTSQLTAAGAKFARFTSGNGRLLVSAGTTGGQTFLENVPYGDTWTPALNIAVNNGTLGVGSVPQTGATGFLAPTAGGTTATAPLDHTHPAPSLVGNVGLGGNGAIWFPPVWAGIWGQRTS